VKSDKVEKIPLLEAVTHLLEDQLRHAWSKFVPGFFTIRHFKHNMQRMHARSTIFH